MAEDARDPDMADLLRRVPVSRRSFVKRLLGGAFAVPVVTTVLLDRFGTLGAAEDTVPNNGGNYPQGKAWGVVNSAYAHGKALGHYK